MPRLALLVIACASSLASAQDVRIGVFGLFHPVELTVSSTTGSAVILHAGEQTVTLDASSSPSTARIRAAGAGLLVQFGGRSVNSTNIRLTSREGASVDSVLSIPGKITRHYSGRLEISNVSGVLVPVVVMDLESAVASVVAAESVPGTHIEALKAQAVAARSYFVAGKGRHQHFDFCDTTHCQFLRGAPALESPAFKAAVATRGLVITFESHTISALYTRSCGGTTRTPRDVGLPGASYSYFSVECPRCRQHPVHWQSRITAQDASGLRFSDEKARLDTDRRLGWNTVQSDDFTLRREDASVVLEGVGQGHGIGLCQAGAKAMAERGSDFRHILAHYYPNTEFVLLKR
jgi:stage II sporulation protein D